MPRIPDSFKRYGCPVCPQRFTELAKKKNHVKTMHPREGEKS